MEITKVFTGFPFAHRVPGHSGHCKRIHGHNWTFKIRFSGPPEALDSNGFLVDLGKMKDLREILAHNFDHTFVVATSDPELSLFLNMSRMDLCRVIVVPSPSCEGIAEYVHGLATNWLLSKGLNVLITVSAVEAIESDANSATYHEGR